MILILELFCKVEFQSFHENWRNGLKEQNIIVQKQILLNKY